MYNVSYMDGVPVKIAEKYKPPPAIYKLHQPLANKLNLEEKYYLECPQFSYDFQLEKKALLKIEEWKSIRQRNKDLRRERILKREEQRKREDEYRQKNLLCSVSYPSTDDLSSGEEEEKFGVYKHEENDKRICDANEIAAQTCVTESVNSFHNILQPTVLSYDNSSPNRTNSTVTPLIKATYDSTLSNSFNYKDFEDDTSSPFDNIELKTINDLDVLAQVLHNTQIKSTTVETPTENASKALEDNTNVISNNCTTGQDFKDFHNNSLITPENIPKSNNNLPRFSYDLCSIHENHQEVTTSSPLQYNVHSPGRTSNTASPKHLYNGLNNNLQSYNRLQALREDQVTKSKSVPDILKELRDEIRYSEIRRYRNCSYNLEKSENNDVCSANETTKPNCVDAVNEDIFSNMNSRAKQLAEQISAMGFPLTRVARIVQLVGTDDKKVIEHLIPLSELADCGFEESKISEALIRNENNKNKALDDLIS